MSCSQNQIQKLVCHLVDGKYCYGISDASSSVENQMVENVNSMVDAVTKSPTAIFFLSVLANGAY